MKRISSLIIISCITFSLFGSWEFVGNYTGSIKREGNKISISCENASVKIEVCSDDIFRIRMASDGVFEKDEPYVVIQYDWPEVDFKLKEKDDHISIRTKRAILLINKAPFGIVLKDLEGKVIVADDSEGSLAWDGDKVICRKTLTDSDHFFGLGQRYEKSDMRGEVRECWVTREETHVPFFMGTDGYGIFFHNTWRSEYDFRQSPYTFSAPGGEMDYYLIYGPDFKHILGQYTEITGKSPLPPKWAFGFVLSRWNEEINGIMYRQDGQKGLLGMVRAAREMWDWPLDGIRVHSMGCDHNFYAKSLHWTDEGNGEFTNIKEMTDQLHAMNCHAMFWETPGVPQCAEMYKEGLEKNYFLINEDATPWVGVYGYLAPPGSLVDFSNPDASLWWGKAHEYMVDAGSDGVAGDWHAVVVDKGLHSPYSGMYGDESRNLFSMLFNQASYDAYKQRNPNKRSVTWGLIYWAGGQRYPMHGTQDSHHRGINIQGEMMGSINLGLSGIPFRIFTDNISRTIDPNQPNSRLSQYLALNVAGERTQAGPTGNPVADGNYRFYGKLKYQWMPYVYSYVQESTRTGLPLMRSLVLEYQDDPQTYDAYGQYLMGEDLLIAPLWSDTTFYRDIYLPEGRWIDYFDEIVYQGNQSINYHAPIDRAPILVKAGAIIPIAPEGQRYVDEDNSSLTVHIYPDGENTFDLYEDDGKSYEYEQGRYAITRLAYKQAKKSLTIYKSLPEGSYSIPERNHMFCIHQSGNVNMVSVNDVEHEQVFDPANYEASKASWFLDTESKRLWIKVPDSVNRELSILIK